MIFGKSMAMAKVEHVDVWPGISVKELVEQFSHGGFQAYKLWKACRIFREMVEDQECTKFLGLAGALVPGGMRKVIVRMIRKHMVDVIVSTGGILTHDLIEAAGIQHVHAPEKYNDVKLRSEMLNRIYNVLLPNDGYVKLEKKLATILEKLPQKTMSSREFLEHLGRHVEDRESIIRAAYDENIKIFCPTIADSVLGFHIWMNTQFLKLRVNPILDQREMTAIAYESKKCGALFVGGGSSKHYIALAMQFSPRSLEYAIQITMDRPEHGGVSGATLSEAKSWGKVAEKAKTVEVICDATIALPIIVASNIL
ncbi:MAG TPA: deoxyhypusine synthase [Candidatus Bathyarchaeota archaeon]|nr:deoxyhypusine synthase [Candidatus Bathyarchaeota archaeon]